MLKIGLTGGIATGKSLVATRLKEYYHLPYFSADQAVADLYRAPDIQESLLLQFGPSVIADGAVSRPVLREKFLSQKGGKEFLENLLHPRVRSAYQQWVISHEHTERGVAEIPLLFETNYPFQLETVWVVACTPQRQQKQLMNRSGLDSQRATALISTQRPLTEKMEKADCVLWNQGSVEHLFGQIDALLCKRPR